MKNHNFSYWLSITFLISAIILSGIFILSGYYYVRDLMFESNRYRFQYEVREILDDVENSMDDAASFTRHLALDFVQEHLGKEPSRFMAMVF